MDIENPEQFLEAIENLIMQVTLRQHAMEMAIQAEPEPRNIIKRAERIEKWLIRSGDELEYAYSTEELITELKRRGLNVTIRGGGVVHADTF